MSNNNNKTYPTKMDLVSAIDTNNEPFTFTVIGPVNMTKIEVKESSTGKSYIRASLPVECQSDRLNQWFDCWYGENETAWIPATIWFGDNGAPGVAGPVMNYLEKCGSPKSVRVVLTGKLAPNFYTDKNGNEQRGVQLTVRNVRFMSPGRGNSNAQSGNFEGGSGNNGGGSYGSQPYNSVPSGNNQSAGAQYFSQNNGGSQQNGGSYQQNGGQQNGGNRSGGYQQNGGQQAQNPQYMAPNGNNGFGNSTGFATIEGDNAVLPF